LDTQVQPLAASAHFTLQQVVAAKTAATETTDEDATRAEASTATPSTATSGAATSGTATSGTATPSTATSGTATSGTEASANQPSESGARLDFLFFFADSGPDPAPAQSGGPEFLQWVKQTELQRTFSVSAAGGGTRIFVEVRDKE